VIATVDEVAEPDSQLHTTIPSFQVDAIVPLHGSARPTASFGFYDVDRNEMARYLKASRTPEGICSYIADFADEQRYLATLGEAPGLAALPQATIAGDAPCSTGELMATVISRSVRDGMFTGAGTGCWEAAAGLRLAQLTHAPGLTFTWGGSGAVNADLPYLPTSLNSDEALARCESRVSLEQLFDFELRGRFDVMFASAMQVDQYGNLNLVVIGPHDHPKLRGPGTVGLEFAPFAGELVIFLRNHSRQTLVEKADFVSGIGYGAGPGTRARWGIDDNRGPALVITNLAVMDFDPVSKRMRVKSVHPGVSVQSVKDQTGFELIVPDQVPVTPPPSAEELQLLRTRIDRGGLLARLVN
jgi:glutaconate CoA-transferase subunit B